MDTQENTGHTQEMSEEPTVDTEKNLSVNTPDQNQQSTDEIKSKRSIRSEKQLEALAKAREKAFAVRREKAQSKKKGKGKHRSIDMREIDHLVDMNFEVRYDVQIKNMSKARLQNISSVV